MKRSGLSNVALVRLFARWKREDRRVWVAVRRNGAAHYVGRRGRREHLKRVMPMSRRYGGLSNGRVD